MISRCYSSIFYTFLPTRNTTSDQSVKGLIPPWEVMSRHAIEGTKGRSGSVAAHVCFFGHFNTSTLQPFQCFCWRECMYAYGGCSKLWYPKTVPTPPFREPCALFRAAAKSIHGILIMFSCVYFVSTVLFRPFANLPPPFRGLSPQQQKTYIHICRCQSGY